MSKTMVKYVTFDVGKHQEGSTRAHFIYLDASSSTGIVRYQSRYHNREHDDLWQQQHSLQWLARVLRVYELFDKHGRDSADNAGFAGLFVIHH